MSMFSNSKACRKGKYSFSEFKSGEQIINFDGEEDLDSHFDKKKQKRRPFKVVASTRHRGTDDYKMSTLDEEVFLSLVGFDAGI